MGSRETRDLRFVGRREVVVWHSNEYIGRVLRVIRLVTGREEREAGSPNNDCLGRVSRVISLR